MRVKQSAHTHAHTCSNAYTNVCNSSECMQTVVLPYYPTGTMERVTKEGQVDCASLDHMYVCIFACVKICAYV